MVFDFSIRSPERGRPVLRRIANLSSGGKNPNAAQCHLVREIFGNPSSPESFEPAWVTSTATTLAREIHNNRSFDAMPILGDALEEAGCPSPAILDHCRGNRANHARDAGSSTASMGLPT